MKKSNEALNEKIYKQFQKGLDFNDRIDLCENVETSENFFIGRQRITTALTDSLTSILYLPKRLKNLFPSRMKSIKKRSATSSAYLPCACFRSTNKQIKRSFCKEKAKRPFSFALRSQKGTE